MWPNIIKSHIIDSTMYCIYLRITTLFPQYCMMLYTVFSPQLILPQFHSSFSPFSGVSGIVGNCCLQPPRKNEELWTPSLFGDTKNGGKKNVSMKCRSFFLGDVFIILCFSVWNQCFQANKNEKKTKFSTCIINIAVSRCSEARFNKKNAKSSTYKAVVRNYSCRCAELSRAM